MKRQVGIAIPTHERVEFTLRSFRDVLHDERVKTITIVDDFSVHGTFMDLDVATRGMEKVKLHRNGRNLDCFLNKKAAIELSTEPWNILADSDNIFSSDYLDKIFDIEEWQPDTIYAPCFASPHFDYRTFSGLTLTRENVASYMSWPMGSTLLNTCNYFVNREEYLKVWRGDIDPITADSIYMAFLWLESGRKIYVVPDLIYHHEVHPLSHYKTNSHKSGHLHLHIEQQLINLR